MPKIAKGRKVPKIAKDRKDFEEEGSESVEQELQKQREVRLANMYQTHIICCMHSVLTTTLLEVSARPKHALHAPSNS